MLGVVGNPGHRPRNQQEMLRKFAGNAFVHRIVQGQFQSHAHERQAVEGHPAGPIRLIDHSTIGKWLASVHHSNVVQTQKSSLKNIPPFRIFSIHPPLKVQHHLVEELFQKAQVSNISTGFAIHLKDAPNSPRVHGGIDIIEVPFIGWKLPIGVHKPLGCQEPQLLLGKTRIHQSQRQAMKRQIPGGIPGIFPFVWHGDHVQVVEMIPIFISPATAGRCGIPSIPL
mmetsp:Transcript_25840/g.42091  ORF Transcript_25840/g.42091 Transcript_25840/m.42091 type:complete len:226 (-) Transcript_25840:354-1031(-)